MLSTVYRFGEYELMSVQAALWLLRGSRSNSARWLPTKQPKPMENKRLPSAAHCVPIFNTQGQNCTSCRATDRFDPRAHPLPFHAAPVVQGSPSSTCSVVCHESVVRGDLQRAVSGFTQAPDGFAGDWSCRSQVSCRHGDAYCT